MPLCPQITNTPVTVTQTGDFVVTSVVPLIADTPDGLANNIQSIEILADGKTKVYRANDEPTVAGINDGDLWIDTNDGNKLYVRAGGVWVSAQDAGIAAADAAAAAAAAAATAAAAAATAAQTTADGKNKVYRQATEPSVGTFSNGDLWFDTDADNKTYRYSIASTSSVTFKSLTSNVATLTVATAHLFVPGQSVSVSGVGSPFDGTYTVTSVPTTTTFSYSRVNADIGTSAVSPAGAAISTAGFYAVLYGNDSLANLSANKLTTGTIDASVITVSNINAGNISVGTLNADRIAAASITGAKLVAGTIEAVSIAAGTITGAKLAAGTITATNIAATTITATQINTLNTLVIGGWTISATKLEIASIGNYIDSNGKAVFATLETNTGNTVLFSGPLSVIDSITASDDVTAERDLFTPNHTTVSDAANGRVTVSLGRVTRSTASSQRYKENITPLRDIAELDPKKLLDIPVRAFTYREDYLSETDSRFGALIPGFIAEEVDAVYPIAADYEDGDVESWNDRMIVPAMLALIQDLYKEVQTLKGE